MKYINRLNHVLTFILILSVLILYSIIIGTDFNQNGIANWSYKWTAIILCVGINIMGWFQPIARRDANLLLIGQSLTILSDYFLLNTGSNDRFIMYGLGIFIAVQFCYLNRGLNSLATRKIVALFLGILIMELILNYFLSLRVITIIYGLVYGILLLSVTLRAFHNKTMLPKINLYLFRIGMLLFILCDLSVLLFNIGDNALVTSTQPLIWLFYTPSQLCLSMSGRIFKYS